MSRLNASFLTKTRLFRGIKPDEIEGVLRCIGSYTKRYQKGDTILQIGESVSEFGIVLYGGVHIRSLDFWGNTSILSHVGPGQIFAESYACIPGEPLMVEVRAVEETEVLFLRAALVMKMCPKACSFHHLLIQNMLGIAAEKNLGLSRRMLHTSPKSIRSRLLSYFSEQAMKQASDTFTIPFNRQELAEYLGVDRSALSNELSKMRKEGLLEYDKKTFTLFRGEWGE